MGFDFASRPIDIGSKAGDLLQQINRCKHERAYLREAGKTILVGHPQMAVDQSCVDGR